MDNILSGTLDRDDLFKPEYRKVVAQLESTMKKLKIRGLEYSNYWGAFGELGEREWDNRGGADYKPYPNAFDDRRVPWFKYWEIAHLITNSGIADKVACKCLDLGGCSSVFSYLLASMGHEVHVIDINERLVENGNSVSKAMNWNLHNYKMDIADLSRIKTRFDYIFSLCVFEHLPMGSRVEGINQVKRLLKSDGVFAITFDYLNPNPHAKIDSVQAVEEQFIKPSGMTLMGNPFKDNGKRYLSYDGKTYTFGALFMKNVEGVIG
jgi:2-polyprenyl-3-methyl-5-hydroxy-6-metoxy-1,4-benzoquinol methylase